MNASRQQIIGCTYVCKSVLKSELLHCQAEVCYLLLTDKMGIVWL